MTSRVAKADLRENVVVIDLNLWTNVMIWILVVSGLYAVFVVGLMTLGTLVWLEAAVLILGLVALVLRMTSRHVQSIR